MKPELLVQIPPLRPVAGDYLQAQARQGDMLAAINLRPYGSNTYIFEQYWDRTNRKIRRKLTPGQDERGVALLQVLRERLTQALEAEGWQNAGVNYEGRPLWRYTEPPASEQPPAPSAAIPAQKPGRSAPVARPQRSIPIPLAPARPVEMLPLVVEQPSIASKQITVAGERQLRQAYSRTLTTRLVTFTCQQCGKQVSQQRFPGPAPRYCTEACKQKARRVGTLARVHRFRARRQEKSNKRP